MKILSGKHRIWFEIQLAVTSWYIWRHRLTFLNLVMRLLFLLNHIPTLWLLNEHFIWIFMNKTAWHWPDAKLFTVKTSKTGRSKWFSKISALIKYSTCTLKLRTVKVHLVIRGRLCYPFAVDAGIWVRFELKILRKKMHEKKSLHWVTVGLEKSKLDSVMFMFQHRVSKMKVQKY